LFGETAGLPSFPNEDIQKLNYGETSAAEHVNLLQKLRAKNQNSISIKTQMTTNLKLVIKCSSLISTQAKT
jgi:hypothetical protein